VALPINITDLLRSGSKLGKEREEPVRLAIVVEPDAPDSLIETVRDRFRPYTSNARLEIEVCEPDTKLVFGSSVDAVIGIVGSGRLGMIPTLADARERYIPTLAVGLALSGRQVAETVGNPYADSVGDLDPVAVVDVEVARWLIERVSDKRLALAHNFPFLRPVVAEEAVRSTALQNGLIGAVVIIPGADMPLMTVNQAKMMLQIAAAYGEHLGADRIKEIGAIVGGGFALRTIARQLLVVIPGFGWALKGAIGYAGTLAMGKAAVAYFDRGGDLGQIARAAVEARDAAVSRLRRDRAALRTCGRRACRGVPARPGCGVRCHFPKLTLHSLCLKPTRCPLPMRNLREQVFPLLSRVERPARYIDSEWGAFRGRDAEHRTVLIYPDTYEVGQANQGLSILYDRLNSTEGHLAERAYVPWIDMAAELRGARPSRCSRWRVAPRWPTSTSSA
jgi:uncharacterized protein (DUF697 family)